MANLVLIIIVAAVAAILLLIKTNSALVFLALCSGDVLVQFADKNMAYINGKLNSGLLPRHFLVSRPVEELVILLLPALLVAALAKHDQSLVKWPIQIFPALATGLVGVLVVVPLLSHSLQSSITANHFWSVLEQFQVPIVGVSVLICLAVVILNSHKHSFGKRHHKE